MKLYGNMYKNIIIVTSGFVCILAVYLFDVFIQRVNLENYETCWIDYTDNGKIKCRPTCSRGSFSLSGMESCCRLLTCDNIQEVRPLRLLVRGVVKNIFLAEWLGKVVVLSNLSCPLYKTDFDHHINMLKEFSPNENIVQLIGYCNHTIITEYHKLGNALNIDNLEKKFDWINVTTRFSFCIHYSKIIAFLHNSPSGTRVMCDSSSLTKTLSQYLLTDDFRLILNDLDALPKVDHMIGQKIKCGHSRLTGNFVAPEQRWPHINREFEDKLMPHYDEKTDIWKIPDVCNKLLGYNRDSDIIKFMLFDIHKQCKNELPHKRPTALSVLKRYKEIMKEII